MAVVALLIAQLGALSHAYSHDAYSNDAYSRGAYSLVAKGHDAQAHDYGHGAFAHDACAGAVTVHASGAGSHDPCGDCLAYAPLLSTAGTTSSPPFALPQGRSTDGRAPARSLIDLSPLLAFQSRAPPSTP